MGGRGVGAWGGGRIAYEMECLDARLLKIGFPIFSPGYGPQNVPASILYSTVGHRGSYKHWRAKRIPDKVATTLLQCSCCRPWPNKTSPCSLALLMHERVEPSQAEPCSSAPQSKSPDEPSCEWSLCEAPQTIRGPSECHCLQNLLTPRHIQSESIQSTVRVHSEYIQSIWIYSTLCISRFKEF